MVDANDARGDVDVAGLVELDTTAALGDPGDDLEKKILSPIIKSCLNHLCCKCYSRIAFKILA